MNFAETQVKKICIFQASVFKFVGVLGVWKLAVNAKYQLNISNISPARTWYVNNTIICNHSNVAVIFVLKAKYVITIICLLWNEMEGNFILYYKLFYIYNCILYLWNWQIEEFQPTFYIEDITEHKLIIFSQYGWRKGNNLKRVDWNTDFNNKMIRTKTDP